MPYTFLVGGARSGKSSSAQRLAHRSGSPVVVVAPAEAGDDEMAERIDRHRRERPDGWITVEEPIDIETAVLNVEPALFVLFDCVTMWITNLVMTGASDDDVLSLSGRLAATLAKRTGGGAVVSNEVGLGIVPDHPLGRRFRDLAGRVNVLFADGAEESHLVVAGRGLLLGGVIGA
ncbi:MAG: bifunctional adenosylcobinamide kinase/adenosylcobinamide-phosphate guanylyltransferase [Acidimicrobiia bacterium]|nr:bifunctional adenosylcobinamide kinase/adenosylcobinamide-phosphate guanylyltransferase [Acidimicrobiia bacterium]MDH4309121.1 bifunctional adenosylcobinamide kinase/adenosylcobinamide-phosphate guanylyltransferase [Acidimicrobiia bacterium]